MLDRNVMMLDRNAILKSLEKINVTIQHINNFQLPPVLAGGIGN